MRRQRWWIPENGITNGEYPRRGPDTHRQRYDGNSACDRILPNASKSVLTVLNHLLRPLWSCIGTGYNATRYNSTLLTLSRRKKGEAWKQLKRMNVPKTYRDWKKATK
jgi:hypothetical protein